MFELGNRANEALYNTHGKFYEVGKQNKTQLKSSF